MNDRDLVEELTNAFLDRMPSKCKICFPDLIDSIWKEYQTFTPPESNIKFVKGVVRDVVYSRFDFEVNRGRGICKR